MSDASRSATGSRPCARSDGSMDSGSIVTCGLACYGRAGPCELGSREEVDYPGPKMQGEVLLDEGGARDVGGRARPLLERHKRPLPMLWRGSLTRPMDPQSANGAGVNT